MHSCGWAHKCQVKLEKAIASSHSFEAVAHRRRTWEQRRRGTPAAAAHDTSPLLAWPLGVAPASSSGAVDYSSWDPWTVRGGDLGRKLQCFFHGRKGIRS